VNYFYVISPVGGDPDFPAKRRVLKQLGCGRDCTPFFPLDHHKNFSIDTARFDLQKATFVLADLSHERPSCYFELGLAEATGSTVVIIAATGTRIHQVGDVDSIYWYSDLEEYRRIIAEVLTTKGCSDKVEVQEAP